MAPILPFEITPLKGHIEWKHSHSQPNATSQQHENKPEEESTQGYVMCAVFGTVFVAIIVMAVVRIILYRESGGRRQRRVGERAIPLSDDASALSGADTVISIQPYGDLDTPGRSSDESSSDDRDHGARGVAVVARPRGAVLRGVRPPNSNNNNNDDGWETPPPPYTRTPSYISRAASSVYSEHPSEAAGQPSRAEGARSEASEHSVYSERPSEAVPEQPAQVEGLGSVGTEPVIIVTSETAATIS